MFIPLRRINLVLRSRAVLRHPASEADGDGKTLDGTEAIGAGASSPSPRQAGADIRRDGNRSV